MGSFNDLGALQAVRPNKRFDLTHLGAMSYAHPRRLRRLGGRSNATTLERAKVSGDAMDEVHDSRRVPTAWLVAALVIAICLPVLHEVQTWIAAVQAGPALVAQIQPEAHLTSVRPAGFAVYELRFSTVGNQTRSGKLWINLQRTFLGNGFQTTAGPEWD